MPLLHLQSVPLDQAEKLANLVRLGLASHLLKVEQPGNIAMGEDVVAAARPAQLEPERLDEPTHVGERNVREIAMNNPEEQRLRSHRASVAVAGICRKMSLSADPGRSPDVETREPTDASGVEVGRRRPDPRSTGSPRFFTEGQRVERRRPDPARTVLPGVLAARVRELSGTAIRCVLALVLAMDTTYEEGT